jgi:hypothetical protein
MYVGETEMNHVFRAENMSETNMGEIGMPRTIAHGGQHHILDFIFGTRTSLVSNVIAGYQETSLSIVSPWFKK